MLPYRQWAAVTGADNQQAGVIRLSTWQSSEPREMATGEVWDWSGEAEIEAAPLLVDLTNRRLYVVASEAELDPEATPPPGRRFNVLAAVRHDFLPHVELRLRENSV
jgi:hypothetical protein